MSISESDSERNLLLSSMVLQSFNSKDVDICKSEITEKDLIIALKSIPNCKSLGMMVTKEFYEQY